MAGSFEQRASAVATEQRGRVSRPQLLAAGLSSPTIARLIGTGYLHPEHHGVYAVGHLAGIPGGPEASALLAAREGAVLSHLTAARWWGIAPTRAHASDGLDTAIHLTVPGNHGGRPAGVTVHRSTILTPRDLRVHDGLPVTAAARVLLDVAAGQPTREVERMLDTALVRHCVTLRQINDVLGRSGRHAGRLPLTQLIEAHTHTTFTRSEAEERFLRLVRDAALPAPLVNVRRHGVEIDFLWPPRSTTGHRGRNRRLRVSRRPDRVRARSPPGRDPACRRDRRPAFHLAPADAGVTRGRRGARRRAVLGPGLTSGPPSSCTKLGDPAQTSGGGPDARPASRSRSSPCDHRGRSRRHHRDR